MCQDASHAGLHGLHPDMATCVTERRDSRHGGGEGGVRVTVSLSCAALEP